MEGPVHGSMVAGASSCLVAAWIRQRTVSEYNPSLSPPPLKERLQQRAPMVAAGLGFVGLSTTVSYLFDTAELAILADYDSPIPINQQIWNHRNLHSFLYLGGAVGTAHLIRHSVDRFGRWIASGLGLSHRVQDVIEYVEHLAEWVINSTGFGVGVHLLGDIPTMGQGGTALRLLHPLTDYNFCLKWVKASSNTVNQYLVTLGMVLSSVAWSFAGLHLCSWKPPEQSITDYLERLHRCESVEAAIQLVFEDMEALFTRLLATGQQTVWNSPLFAETTETIRQRPWKHWHHMEFDMERIFDISELSRKSLLEKEILPPEVGALLDKDSIYSIPGESHGLDAVSLDEDASEAHNSLFTSPDSEAESLFADVDEESLLDTTDNTSGESLRSPSADTSDSSLFDE